MPPFQVAYDVPPECPNEAAFIEGVRARLPEDFEAASGGQVVALDVRVTRDAAGYRASIELPAAGGQRATRSVSGKSCENVIRGSALVTALALEARVADQARTERTPEDAAATRAPASPPPPSPPRPRPAPESSSSRPARARTAPASAPSEASPVSILVGARASVGTGVAPAAVFGLGLFASVRAAGFGVGLTLESARSGRVRSQGVPAEYALDAARLEGTISSSLVPGLELDGVVWFEGGVLGAEAIPDPPTVLVGTHGSAAWLAPGAAARLRASAGPVFVSAEVFSRAPLVRERFFVDIEGERRVAHRVPYFSVGGALMAGARF